jgi:thioredoxin reductase
MLLRSWSQDVTVFTGGAFDIPPELRAQLEGARIRIEPGPIVRLRRNGQTLEGVELASGDIVPCEVLFAHPPQHHVDAVVGLGLSLDDDGYVRVDPMTRETSMPGVYAAGDLTTRAQGAIFAASTGVMAVAMLNHELTAELAASGAL